jgi:hypothetical protein
MSIRGAATAFRDFTGESTLQFEVSGPFDEVGGAAYRLNSTSVDPGAVFVGGTVDARTGMVLSVEYTARVHNGPGAQLAPFGAMLAKTKDYLSLHSVDVAGLSVTSAPTDYGWEFTWEKMAGEVGTPPRVTVVVDWQTTGIVSFRREMTDLGTPPAPVVTRDQVEARALSQTWLGQPKVEASRLRYADEGYPGKILVWFVYVSGKGDDATLPTYITYKFDAVTGLPI